MHPSSNLPPKPLLNPEVITNNQAEAGYVGVSLKQEDQTTTGPKSSIGIQAKSISMSGLKPAERNPAELYKKIVYNTEVMNELSLRLLDSTRVTKTSDEKLNARVNKLFTSITENLKNPDDLKQLAQELKSMADSNKARLESDPAMKRGTSRSSADSSKITREAPVGSRINVGTVKRHAALGTPESASADRTPKTRSVFVGSLTKEPLEDKANLIADVSVSLRKAEGQREYQQKEVTRLTELVKAKEQVVKELEGNLINVPGKLSSEKAALGQLKSTLEKYQSDLGKADAEVNTLRSKLGKLNADVAAINANPAQARSQSPTTFHRVLGIPEIGLNAPDAQKLDIVIHSNLPKWEAQLKAAKPGEHLHISHDPNLPRSLDIFMEEGQVKVMVLCKTKTSETVKNPSLLVGAGVAKSVKRAVEWQSGQVYAEEVMKKNESNSPNPYSMTDKEKQQLKSELEIHRRLAGKPGISAAAMGFQEYLSKDVDANKKRIVKTRFYQPLYANGTMQSYVIKHQAAGTMTPSMTATLVNTLLDGGITLKNERTLHQDPKEDNLLVDGEGRAFVADFGTAVAMPQIPPGQSITDQELQLYQLGNEDYRSPQRMLLSFLEINIKDQFQKNDPEMKQLIQRSRAIDTQIDAARKQNDSSLKSRLVGEKKAVDAQIETRTSEHSRRILTPLYNQYAPFFETFSIGMEIIGVVAKQNIRVEDAGKVFKYNKLAKELHESMRQIVLEITSSLTPEIAENRAKLVITPQIANRIRRLGFGEEFTNRFPKDSAHFVSDLMQAIIDHHLDRIDQSQMNEYEKQVFNELRGLMRANPQEGVSLEEAKARMAAIGIKA